MSLPSLRARLVAAFVGVVAVATLLAAVLTMLVVHRTFDDSLDRRAGEAVRGAVQSAGDPLPGRRAMDRGRSRPPRARSGVDRV